MTTTRRRLSPIEEAIWIECQTAEGSAAYNIPYVLRLSGDLDVPALRGALAGIVRDHDALRTAYGWEDGTPAAFVHDLVRPELTVVDHRAEQDGEPSGLERPLPELTRAHIAELTREVFDLARPPLLRAALFHLAPGESVLCLVMHHLITDGRSREVLFDALRREYGARLSATADAAVDTTEAAAGAGADTGRAAAPAYGDWTGRHRRYWARRFDEAARHRPDRLLGAPAAGRGHRGARIERTLERPALVRLRKAAARRRCTMSATLLAAWGTVVARFGGSRRVPVAVISAGRDAHNADIVGPFAVPVPVVLDVDPAVGFGTAMEDAAGRLRDVMGRQVIPLHALRDDAPVPEEWRRALDVMFVHTTVPPSVTIGGLKAAYD